MTSFRLAALACATALAATAAPSLAVPSDDAPSFAWLTPELAARADAAGPRGVPLPAGAADDLPATSLTFTGIRPGTLLLTIHNGEINPQPPFPSVSGCTANFVFQTTAGAFDKTQQLYIGTAGHCVEDGADVQAVVVGPGGTEPVLLTIGTVVVDSASPDFALISIDTALNDWVSPSMAYWGGPTGTYAGGAGEPLTFVGHLGFAGGAAPRVGVHDGGDGVTFQFTTLSGEGDSGGPVTTAGGLAVGETVRLFDSTCCVGNVAGGPTIATMLDLADKPLATCPSRTPWPAPGCPPPV